MADFASIARLAAPHHGVVTTAQLEGLRVTRASRRAMVASGFLETVGKGTYVVAAVPPSARRAAAIAVAVTGGAASRRTSAHLHGIPGFVLPVIPEVMVRHEREHHRCAVADLHGTTNLPSADVIEVDGICCLSVARTLLSLAALVPSISMDRVRGAVDDSVRLRLATDAWLWWRLEELRCRGRNGVAAFEEILSTRAQSATESWLEREYLKITAVPGIPIPICQARIGAKGAFAARVDFLYPEVRLVVEVSGAVAHASAEQRAGDAARRNRLLLEGYLVLEFTYEQVVREPELVVAAIREALARRAVAA